MHRGEPRECRMSENNTTNSERVGLPERILDDRYLQGIYDRVCSKEGSVGIDGYRDRRAARVNSPGLESRRLPSEATAGQ